MTLKTKPVHQLWLSLAFAACGGDASTVATSGGDTSPPPTLCAQPVDCDAIAGRADDCRTWTCVAGECVQELADDGAPCASDGNPCTLDRCAAGACRHAFDADCECQGFACPPQGDYGDSLVLSHGGHQPIEAVGSAYVDGHVLVCGGFGLDPLAVEDDGTLTAKAGALPRCQNLSPGPTLADGRRVVYAAHHGDAYVPTAAVYRLELIHETGRLTNPTPTTTPGMSPEGLAWDQRSDLLWVAAHAAGVLRFELDPRDGTLGDQLPVLSGFDNAYRLTLDGDHVFVADGIAGLKVLDRASGALIAERPTPGFASHVSVTNAMAFVATASTGVTVFDLSDRANPALIETIFTEGQAMLSTVFDGGDKVAVANWNDVVVLDARHRDALKILAVDRGTPVPNPPRLLSVAARHEGERIFASDWLGTSTLVYDDTVIGPEFHVDRSALIFVDVAAGDSRSGSLRLSNRGYWPLIVDTISVTDAGGVFSVSPSSAELQPGESTRIRVSFTPDSAEPASARLAFSSNDPDEPRPSVDLVGNPSTSRLGPGDLLTEDFDFLDVASPPGAQSVDNLKGNILVLAYFATF